MAIITASLIVNLLDGNLLEAEILLDQLVEQIPPPEVSKQLAMLPDWAITKLATLVITMGSESVSSTAIRNELTARDLEEEAA